MLDKNILNQFLEKIQEKEKKILEMKLLLKKYKNKMLKKNSLYGGATNVEKLTLPTTLPVLDEVQTLGDIGPLNDIGKLLDEKIRNIINPLLLKYSKLAPAFIELAKQKEALGEDLQKLTLENQKNNTLLDTQKKELESQLSQAHKINELSTSALTKAENLLSAKTIDYAVVLTELTQLKKDNDSANQSAINTTSDQKNLITLIQKILEFIQIKIVVPEAVDKITNILAIIKGVNSNTDIKDFISKLTTAVNEVDAANVVTKKV